METSWHFGSPGHVHRFSKSYWAHLKQFFRKASAKMLTSKLSPAESGFTRAGQQVHSKRAICQTSGFEKKPN